MDKAKNIVMERILQKLRGKSLQDLATYIENYVKEFGEESRDFFIATMWDTWHLMNV